MPERGFLIFWFFFLFFSEFSCPGRVWTEFGTKIFFSLSRLILSCFGEKWCRDGVFQFFEFFCYVFRNFLARVGYEWNSGRKFFCLFLGLSHPVCVKIMPERGFWIFLLFFSEFSSMGRVWTEFETKTFLLLTRPISSCLG